MTKPANQIPVSQTPARPGENPTRPADPGAPSTPKPEPEDPAPREKEEESGPSSPDPDIPELNPDPVPGQDPVRPMMQNLC
jgi:hypothetical protein